MSVIAIHRNFIVSFCFFVSASRFINTVQKIVDDIMAGSFAIRQSKNDSDAILRRRKRFVMRADEKLTAFLELETAIRPTSTELHFLTKSVLATQFAPQSNQAERSETEQR